MLWDNDAYELTEPDSKMFIIVRADGYERTLPEKILKEMFGNRWNAIQLGQDKEFKTYPVYD